jgi:hypothetical protein
MVVGTTAAIDVVRCIRNPFLGISLGTLLELSWSLSSLSHGLFSVQLISKKGVAMYSVEATTFLNTDVVCESLLPYASYLHGLIEYT